MNLTNPSEDEYRTQEQWISYFNERNQRMISMSDIFKLVKRKDQEAIESLRRDFDRHWIVTSTRIVYDKNNLSAKIIHNAGSKIVTPKEIKVKQIEDYTDAKLADLLDTDEGLAYIKALLDTKASKGEIIDFFTALSGKKESKTRFWTPTQSSRAGKQIRAVGLGFYGWSFLVDGGCWFDGDDGLSRGVTIDSAPKEQGKIKSCCKKAVGLGLIMHDNELWEIIRCNKCHAISRRFIGYKDNLRVIK